MAQTKPTPRRPGTSYKVAEDMVTLYGTAYRAVVVQSSTQDQRRQHRLDRDAAKQVYFCQADAEAAAAKLRTLPSAYHQVEVTVEAQPQYGRGRPSRHCPRPMKAMHYRLKPTLREYSEVIARKRAEAA